MGDAIRCQSGFEDVTGSSDVVVNLTHTVDPDRTFLYTPTTTQGMGAGNPDDTSGEGQLQEYSYALELNGAGTQITIKRHASAGTMKQRCPWVAVEYVGDPNGPNAFKTLWRGSNEQVSNTDVNRKVLDIQYTNAVRDCFYIPCGQDKGPTGWSWRYATGLGRVGDIWTAGELDLQIGFNYAAVSARYNRFYGQVVDFYGRNWKCVIGEADGSQNSGDSGVINLLDKLGGVADTIGSWGNALIFHQFVCRYDTAEGHNQARSNQFEYAPGADTGKVNFSRNSSGATDSASEQLHYVQVLYNPEMTVDRTYFPYANTYGQNNDAVYGAMDSLEDGFCVASGYGSGTDDQNYSVVAGCAYNHAVDTARYFQGRTSWYQQFLLQRVDFGGMDAGFKRVLIT